MFIWIALKMFVGEVISGVLWLIPCLLFLISLLAHEKRERFIPWGSGGNNLAHTIRYSDIKHRIECPLKR